MRKFEKHSWIAMNMNSFETKEIFYDNNEDDTASLESSMEEKFKITEVLKEKLKDLPEVLEMIVKLQKLIAKQRKRIKKLKTKLKVCAGLNVITNLLINFFVDKVENKRCGYAD